MKNGEGMGRDLYAQLGTTAESRAAARVQVVVVDERGELAVDGVLDRRVHGAVDVSRELRDQPGLDFRPEPFVGVARNTGRVADLELGDGRGRDRAARRAAREAHRERARGLRVRRLARLRAEIYGRLLVRTAERALSLALKVEIGERELER